MFTVVAHQLRRHTFHLPAVEHVQEQGLQDIVAVVAQGDFGCAQFRSGAVKNAAAQTGAERAGGFTFRNFFFNDAVGIFFNNLIFHAQLLKIFRQNMLREARLFLIEVDRHQ